MRDVACDALSSRGLVSCHLGLRQFIQLVCTVNAHVFGVLPHKDRTLLDLGHHLDLRLPFITDLHC